jgi:hypothetical protein
MPPKPSIRDRLKRDVRVNVGMLAALAACVPATLGWVGVLIDPAAGPHRASPVFWLIVLPLAAWAYGLVGFSIWALRLLRPILLAAPLAAAVACAVAVRGGQDPTWWIVGTAASILLGAAGLVLLRGKWLAE